MNAITPDNDTLLRGALKRDEEWRSIEGFPLYEVSNRGRVRSLLRTHQRPNPVGGALQTVRAGGRILRGWIKRQRGRPVCVKVALRRDGETVQERVHRLVLRAFVGLEPENTEGCHNDGNPLNNVADNLRWDTHASNLSDMAAHGTRRNPPIHHGEAHPQTRLTAGDIAAIRGTPISRGVKARLAREYEVSATTINRIIQRRVWTNV